jgi:hypothetical protein
VRRRPHPSSVGRKGPSPPPPGPPSSRPPPSWPAQCTTSCRTAEPGEGQPPHADLGGSEKVGKFPLAIYGRVERASKFGPCDGAGVQVRGAKRGGGARRRRARGVWDVEPTCAARRNPRRKARRPVSELAVTNAHRRAARACTCGCLQHTARLATLPSAQWSQCCRRLQRCKRTRGRPHRAAVRTRTRTRTRGGPTQRTRV